MTQPSGEIYLRAGILLGLGVLLWLATRVFARSGRAEPEGG
jgi:hypothetical protein